MLVPSKHLVEPEGSVLIVDTHPSPLSALLGFVATNYSHKKILFFFKRINK
jgi:uracil DNA glycosylase